MYKIPTPRVLYLLSFLVIFLSSGISLQAEKSDTESALAEILEHYETVRLTLTQDSLEGVAEQGRQLATTLTQLQDDWSPQRAAVSQDDAEAAQALLPELSAAATALADSKSLETARDAFYALSKPLVRWRKLADGELPAVAYCSMARRSWLQPKGELGNPYYGSEMPRCGELVDG